MRPPASSAATSLAALIDDLVRLRVEAGEPSLGELSGRIAAARLDRGESQHGARVSRSTLHGAFQAGRRRLNADLVGEIVAALGATPEQAAAWVSATGAAQRSSRAAQVVVSYEDVPAPLEGFVGREAELAELLDALDRGERTLVVSGMGGLGKTELARRLARQLLEDGSIEHAVAVDLRGHDTHLPPTEPRATLDAVLRRLGVVVVPEELDEAQGLLGQRLRDRPCVLLLDDAADLTQVATLLDPLCEPGRSALVITTRVQPPPREGTHVVALGPLDHPSALQSFAAAVGASRVSAEADAASALTALADGHPLALGLLAQQVVARPDWPLADHLARHRARREQLRVAEEVDAVIRPAYDAVGEAARSVLRRVASLPAAVEADVLVEALDLPAVVVEESLAELAARHLVTLDRHGLVMLHDLVATWARDLAVEEERPALLETTRRRAGEALVARAWGAHLAVNASTDTWRLPAPGRAVHTFDQETATRWLAEVGPETLAYVAALDDDDPLLEEASDALASWLDLTGRYLDGARLHAAAVEAATRRDDQRARARALVALGHAQTRLGRLREARVSLGECYAWAVRGEEPGMLNSVVNGQAIADFRLGDLDAALAKFREGADLAHAQGRVYEESVQVNNMAAVLGSLGRHDEAVEAYRRSLGLAEQLQQPLMVSTSLVNMAESLEQVGRLDEALDAVTRGMDVASSSDNPLVLAYAHLVRGGVLVALGSMDEACEVLDAGLPLAERVGDPEIVSGGLIHRGRARVARRDRAGGRSDLERALEMATAAGHPARSDAARAALADLP